MIQRIPKVIHYCWFGRNEKSDLIKECIKSWETKLPDYKVIEWNEENFDVDMIEYTKQAYAAKKYAFVSDYARLWIINTYGGIYLDTDVEVLKNLDRFLVEQAFMPFEGNHGVALGLIFGSQKNNPVLVDIMQIYESTSFIKSDGTYNLTTIVHNTTNVLLNYGLILDCNLTQRINGVKIYPTEYFCPNRAMRESKNYSENTYTAHHYDASWQSVTYKKRLKKPLWRLFIKFVSVIGMLSKMILGEKKWECLRNKYFKKLYNTIRGQ